MRRADQFTLQVIGPAVQRANNIGGVAAPAQHLGLAVTANIGDQLQTLGVTHQHPAIVLPWQGGVVAFIRHHQRVAGVARALFE